MWKHLIRGLATPAVIILMLSLTGGCALVPKAEEAVADVEEGRADTAVYPLDEREAMLVARQALAEGWPDKDATPLPVPRLGYQIELWFVIDRERIIAEVIAEGDGHRFTVINRGTAPVSGVPARKKLLRLIEKEASTAVQANAQTE